MKTALIIGNSGIGRACKTELEERGWVVDVKDFHFQMFIGEDTNLPKYDLFINTVGRLTSDKGGLGSCVLNYRSNIEPFVMSLLSFREIFEWEASFVERHPRRFITISSRAGLLEDVLPKRALYSGAKAFMNAATVSIDQDLREYGGRAISICPGLVRDTAMGKQAMQQHDHGKGMLAAELSVHIADIAEAENPAVVYRIDENKVEVIL